MTGWSAEEDSFAGPSTSIAHGLRDGVLVNDLDRSFGSSMSISSLDSPARHSLRRARPFPAPAQDLVGEDPFTMPSPSLNMRPRLSVPAALVAESSPHAMEISSPPAFDTSSNTLLVQTTVPPPMLRRLDRSVRKSMPVLMQSGPGLSREPLSPVSPEHARPLKKRLSSLRQLQDASFERDGPARCILTQNEDEANVSQDTARFHVRSQSASLWWPDAGESIAPDVPLSSPAAPGPMACADDSTASDSFLAPSLLASASTATVTASTALGVSPSPMGHFFFDPQSPSVAQAPPMVSSPVSPSGTVTQFHMFAAPDWRLGPSDAPVGATTATTTTTTTTTAAAAADTSLSLTSAGESTDPSVSLDDSTEPIVQRGSPVCASARKAMFHLGMRRTQTTTVLPASAKENVPMHASVIAPPPPHRTQDLPGFGTHEMENKILPCFSVKSDGLMRVAPETVCDLMKGRYDDRISGFQIVDCRFDYEYEGGHIAGAVNLSTVEQVQRYFLTPGEGLHRHRPMPGRTQSGMPDGQGDIRKFILIFHCEFCHKRGPSMALALRQSDRSLAGDYPNCHFPDMYILHGGYADFFKACPEMCVPQAYVPMDDPRFLQRRSSELSGFRRQFSRNRSFAYGDSQVATTALSNLAEMRRAPSMAVPGALPPSRTLFPQARAAPAPVVPAPALSTSNLLTLPEPARDASFSSCDSSFEAGAGDSPCAAAGGRRPPLGEALQPRATSFAPRLLKRADTTSVVVFPM
ncbi:tyrosine phosphatase [Malassezia pachydermatis]|uniref:M-phase inducer phosphatase n=1 Tax=Malassezia pachydermatis TaxID=77020 RepID=A0A0M9VR52_9BASI|nr:tyrosine phosphatase [Malassezia pachydermatis]KOS16202.1 tyrosine phosphatase [Malassezia pachydermatis]